MFLGTGRSSTSTNGCSSRLSIGRGSSGSTSLRTPERAHGEPYSVFPKTPRIPTSLMIHDPTSCLREQHIVSLIAYTSDGVERSGHIGDLVSRSEYIVSVLLLNS